MWSSCPETERIQYCLCFYAFAGYIFSHMKPIMKTPSVLLASLLLTLGANAQIINDDSLIGYYTDPGSNFDPGTTTWSNSSTSTNASGNLTLAAASSGPDPVAGTISGTDTVRFLASGTNFTVMSVEALGGGGATFGDLTLIGVYAAPSGSDKTRPLGIGSNGLGSRGSNINQAADDSLRFDDGNSPGSLDMPDESLFVRATRKSGATNVADWYRTSSGFENNITSTHTFADGTTNNDTLALGDLMGGVSNVEMNFAAVLLYDRALSDAEVEQVSNALYNSLVMIPEPGTTGILFGLSVLGFVLVRRIRTTGGCR